MVAMYRKDRYGDVDVRVFVIDIIERAISPSAYRATLLLFCS